MVVQCPACESRFRIADEKVTEKGVRVRCTTCKHVFGVRKSGASTGPIVPGPGQAMDLSSPPPASRPRTDPIKVPGRSLGSAPPPPKNAGDDDLFGMSELTGDAPPARPSPPSGMPSFDDIELEVADTPARPITQPQPEPRARPTTDPLELAARPITQPQPEPARSPTTDPFSDGAAPRRTERRTGPVPRYVPQPVKPSARDLLTALVVAAGFVLVVLAAFAASSLTADGGRWAEGGDLVARGEASGYYETASGKPVFYVRGRVENRGREARGPLRVVVELAGARGETLAGAEPTPEEVAALASPAEVAKLGKALDARPLERRVQPGASLPFFALVAEPPPGLAGQRLQLHVESADDRAPRKR